MNRRQRVWRRARQRCLANYMILGARVPRSVCTDRWVPRRCIIAVRDRHSAAMQAAVASTPELFRGVFSLSIYSNRIRKSRVSPMIRCCDIIGTIVIGALSFIAQQTAIDVLFDTNAS